MDEDDVQEMKAELESLKESVEVVQEMLASYIRTSGKGGMVAKELKAIEVGCPAAMKRSILSRVQKLLS